MRAARLIAAAALAACGAPSRPRAEPVRVPPPQTAATYVFRTLTAGATPRRTSFVLVLDRAHATLEQREERAEREQWQVASSTTYAGTRTSTRTDVGDRGELDLALATPGEQPLALHCTRTHVSAAAAGAALACADRARWPTTTVDHTAPPFGGADSGGQAPTVDALLCAPPGETGSDAEPPDPDDEDQLVFAALPGLERVRLPEGCTGLRIAR